MNSKINYGIHFEELDNFVIYVDDGAVNDIRIIYNEKHLNFKNGLKVIKYLQKLKKQKIKFIINEESLKPCLFKKKDKQNIKKNYKISENKISKKCFYCEFYKKECFGNKGEAFRGKVSKLEDISFDHLYAILRSEKLNKEFIEKIIDSKLKKVLANNDEIIWGYLNFKGKVLDYDYLFHCIELYKKIGQLKKLKGNLKLIKLIKECYQKRKKDYILKQKFHPRDNRWSKLICILKWLGLLDKKEQEFWIKKYIEMKYDKSKPLFPQC
jgi:hypothetical protein